MHNAFSGERREVSGERGLRFDNAKCTIHNAQFALRLVNA